MKCEKVDLRKINFKKTAAWNVWKQFGVNLDEVEDKINVTEHYMPETEQMRLVEYYINNYRKVRAYKTRTKKFLERIISWEILGYFPSSVIK